MEILLASLLLIMSHMNTTQSDLSIEQLVEASKQVRYAAEMTQPAKENPINEEQVNVEQVAIEPADEQSVKDRVLSKNSKLKTPIVKGVYSTAHTANGPRLEKLLKLMDETSLNAIVIDVKDDWGNITWRTTNPQLESMGTSKKIIADLPKLMKTLEEHDVYPIARIVVFKDTILANKRPEYSFLTADGKILNNRKAKPESFVNPYMKEVWDYNIEVAKEAAKAGFREIQFDYVRFPEGFEKIADSVRYTRNADTRIDVVAGFVEEAKKQLRPYGVKVSVDIFGYAASVPAAEGIGQDFEKISRHVDVICPMIYPSHYSTGWYGSVVPDAAPYTTINGAIVDTHEKLETLRLEGLKPIIRPWIQDFTASWIKGYIKYNKNEIEEQIKALRNNGVEEFLLWNSGNTYTPLVNYDVQ